MLTDATSATTRGIITQVEFKWTIHDTLKWPGKEGESMDSPLFHAKNDKGTKWGLKIQKCISWVNHAQIKANNPSQDSMSLVLYLSECPVNQPTVTARYSVTITDEVKEGKSIYEKKNSPIPFSAYGGHNSACLHSNMLIGNREEFLKIPKVLIHITIEYEKEQIVTTSSTSNLINGVSASKSSWSTDFEKLLTSQIGSDICFIIAGQEIKAHKAILSARSPVFAAMFNSDMKEKGLEQVDIPDTSPENFKEFLRFIYTDRVQLTEKNAEPLLAAADKYLIPTLKWKCEEYLIEYMTTENCIELMRMADMHDTFNLKSITEGFFRSNHIEVRKTDGWKALKESHPDIALDIIEVIILNDL